MAETSEFDRVGASVHRMAEDLARSDKAAHGVESAFSGLFRQLVGAEVVGSVVRDIIKNSRAMQAVQQVITAENRSRARLLQREIDLTNDLHFHEGRRRFTTGNVRDLHAETVTSLKQQLNVLQKQKLVAAEINGITWQQAGFMSAMATAGTAMFLNSRQFNQNLIEANSSWQHRDRLIRQTLVTQVQLGIGFDSITKSAAALVHYGMDMEASWETNLRLVSQMEQGLGVSVGESARLASIVERQIKGSFESVAHVIAQIVDDTALAGDEAARLATNIATAMGRLRPGLSAAGLPEVIRLVGRYESALKEVGGQSGAFQQLLTQLTTPEGLTGAGALGVNPDFIATSQGVQQVMDRFANYGEMLIGQSQGWERQMRLQALSQIFNVSADQANQMLIAIQRANKAQMGQISTQERWKNQLDSTNSGILRLGNSLTGLLQGAMYPVVFVVGALANRLADAVQWVTQYKEVVYAAGAALFVGTVALAASMWNLARALWQTVAASTVAQAVMSRHAALQGAGTAMSVGGALRSLAPTGAFFTAIGTQLTWIRMHLMSGTGLASVMTGIRAAFMNLTMAGAGFLKPLIMLVRGVALLATPLGAIVGLTVGILGYAAKMSRDIKRLTEQNEASKQIIMAAQDKLASERQMRIYQAARYSEDPTAELAKVYELRLQDIIAEDISWAEKRSKMAQARTDFDEDVLTARVTRGLGTPLVERTPQEQKVDSELRDIDGKVLDVNEKMEEHMLLRIQMERERLEEERGEAAKDRLQRQQPRPYRMFY